MAQKKEVKVRDLKPSKDAKGGAARTSNASLNRASGRSNDAKRSTLGGGSARADRGSGRTAN